MFLGLACMSALWKSQRTDHNRGTGGRAVGTPRSLWRHFGSRRKYPWRDLRRQGQGSGAASNSTDGRGHKVAGEWVGTWKKIKAADWSTDKRISVRRENIWELHKILVEKGSLRKTYKS